MRLRPSHCLRATWDTVLTTKRFRVWPATIAEHVARAIERSLVTPRTQTRRQLYEREAREGRAYSDWSYDLLDDAVPAFHKQPFVTVS